MDTAVFTGLVEATGKLRRREARGPGFVMTFESPLQDLVIGESIAVNGACLTVVTFDGGTFTTDVSRETVARTTLGSVRIGGVVNLERSLRVGDRIGGHLVGGHVDGLARVTNVDRVGDAWRVTLEAPPELSPLVAEKGSVALDGISLTVNGVSGTSFEVMLIPHTVAETNLTDLVAGRQLNLEVDVIARYVQRLVGADSGGVEAALKRVGLI